MLEDFECNSKSEFFDEIAAVLFLPRETLPSNFEVEQPKRPTPMELAMEGVALTDEEWRAIAPIFPKGVAHHARDDRAYLNACLWRGRAKRFKKGWWFVPTLYGPTSSNRGRFLRWGKLGYWTLLYEGMVASGRISAMRLAEFAAIKGEAEDRQAPTCNHYG